MVRDKMFENWVSTKMLRLLLYSGIGLIVVSMLFLGRGEAFVTQAALVIAMPVFFYVVGGLVYRYLEAPLAAPGIVATGAWLVAVGLVHIWDQRELLPEVVRSYYWVSAALFAAVLITLTGHEIKFALLIPLVPLTQVNAIWAVMNVTGIGIEWWAALSFLLVLAWWEAPFKDWEWAQIYKVSAVLLTLFLLIFSYWFPAPTAKTMLITWGACAGLVALLGFRHGWASLGSLAIVLLACAAAWGLPPTWWSAVWLIIGAGTVIFIERLARQRSDENKLALDLAVALAVLLSGFAALTAKLFPFLGIEVHPLVIVLVLAGSGVLMGWIGLRGSISTAQHAGLWLIASAWGEFYFFGFPSGAFGLWLALLAVLALLAERLLTSVRKQKRKMLYSIGETMVRWALADLTLGLTAIIVIWSAVNIMGVAPLTLALTLAVVIGTWITAGLIYRLPILLHIALWLAPLPYALLLLLTVPFLRHLEMIGLAWQVLGALFVLLGHIIPKYRPAMLAPFFVAGYALLAFGLTFTMVNPALLMVSLGLVILVCLATSIAVATDGHPAWSAVIAWLISPEDRPYAFKHIHNLFVLLTAWLLVIWLQLLLEYVLLPFSPGIVLVLLSVVWIMLGRLLPRFPGMVGWYVYGAGWFMWLVGLLQVFFSPTEAIVTAILGLAFSGEFLQHSKEVYWMPVFILQVVFTVLQVAWMFALPAHNFVLATLIVVAVAGMWYEKPLQKAGSVTAQTGGLLAMCVWLMYPDLVSTIGMLVLVIAALLTYRRWEYLLALGGVIAALIVTLGLHSNWQFLLISGTVELLIGVGLVNALRPRHYRNFSQFFLLERDLASPFLWFGSLSLGLSVFAAPENTGIVIFILSIITAIAASWARVARLPYVPVGLLVASLFSEAFRVTEQGFAFGEIGMSLVRLHSLMVVLAVAFQALALVAVLRLRPFPDARWLVWWVRPLLKASILLTLTSIGIMFTANMYPGTSPLWAIVNLLVLMVFCSLVFIRTGRMRWIWIEITMGGAVWVILLGILGLTGLQWYLAPLVMLLLTIGYIFEDQGVELIGIAVLVGGAIGAQTPLAMLVVGIQLVALAVYGYWSGRRIPFFSAVGVIGSGVALKLFLFNPWLVPLMIGCALLCGAVILEVQRERVERWVRLLQEWR